AGQESPYTVTAVLRDTPPNSSIDFEIVLPFERSPGYLGNQGNWHSQFHNVYLRLQEGTVPEDLEVGSRAMIDLHYKSGIEKAKRDGALPDAHGQYKQLRLLPVADMHFADFDGGIALSNRSFRQSILVLAFVVLFIVCAHFINLYIAWAGERLKELGMRQTLGAQRTQPFVQLWLESIGQFTASLGLGLLAV